MEQWLFLNLNDNLVVLFSFELGGSRMTERLVNQNTFPLYFCRNVFYGSWIMLF